MELSDIILAIIIIFVPIYIYLSSKTTDNNIVDYIFSKITGIFNNPKSNYVVNNDSAISSTNYEVIDNNPVVNIIRNKGKVTGENTMYYEPKYIRKDTMNENDIGSTEYGLAQLGDMPDKAWTDYNISQFPGYYRSDFGNGLRSLKRFFDRSNKYHEKPNNRKYYEIKEPNCPSCYIDVNGTNVCNFNGKLEKIPISLYNVLPDGNSAIQPVVGSSIESVDNNQYKTYSYKNDRAMNGGDFYKNVKGVEGIHDKYENYKYNDIIKCMG